MIDFLVRFDKVKVKPNQGTQYLYSEKHAQKGYPFNPYNYKDMSLLRGNKNLEIDKPFVAEDNAPTVTETVKE